MQFVIVQRGKLATFELLARTFADDATVHVIWDRRARDRRQAEAPVHEDRRRQDRRCSPPSSWEHFQFVLVSPPSTSRTPSH